MSSARANEVPLVEHSNHVMQSYREIHWNSHGCGVSHQDTGWKATLVQAEELQPKADGNRLIVSSQAGKLQLNSAEKDSTNPIKPSSSNVHH